MCHTIESLLIDLLLIVLTWATTALGIEAGTVEELELSPVSTQIELDTEECPLDVQRLNAVIEFCEFANSIVRHVLGAGRIEAVAGIEDTGIMILEDVEVKQADVLDILSDSELEPGDKVIALCQLFEQEIQLLGAMFIPKQVDKENLRTVRQMLQPTMAVELERVQQTCDLSADQRPEIRKAAESGLKQAARKLVELELGDFEQLVDKPGVVLDPQGVIRKRMIKVMKRTLPGRQMACYQDDLAKFVASRKQAIVSDTVSKLDEQLRLTSEQRESIFRAVMGKLAESFDGYEQVFAVRIDENVFFPQVIDALVRPHLNFHQRRVWKALVKYEPSEWMDNLSVPDLNLNDIVVGDLDEDWWAGKTP